jgi:hypothetical protein
MDICPYCNFNFTEGMNKDEHIIKCQNLNNIKNKDFETTPSLHSLYKMVLELQKDNKKLHKKIQRLENKTFKKKEKKTIFEWLILHGNDIYDQPLNDFNGLCKILIPNEYHLTYLFQTGFIGGYGKIIGDFYDGYFVAWEQKKQIYCWKGEWSVFTEEDLSKIVSKIQKRLMNVYSEWSQKTRTNSTHFNKYMAMILGGESSERKKKNRTIYLNLWKSLKRDFHRETEYQITF